MKRMMKSVSFGIVLCIVLLLSGLGVKRLVDRKKPVEASEIEPEPLLLPVKVEAALRVFEIRWRHRNVKPMPISNTAQN